MERNLLTSNWESLKVVELNPGGGVGAVRAG